MPAATLTMQRGIMAAKAEPREAIRARGQLQQSWGRDNHAASGQWTIVLRHANVTRYGKHRTCAASCRALSLGDSTGGFDTGNGTLGNGTQPRGLPGGGSTSGGGLPRGSCAAPPPAQAGPADGPPANQLRVCDEHEHLGMRPNGQEILTPVRSRQAAAHAYAYACFSLISVMSARDQGWDMRRPHAHIGALAASLPNACA